MNFIDRSKTLQQLVPLFLSIVILGLLTFVLHLYIFFLNRLPTASKVILVAHPVDIFVGITIYLKTAIDFAIFMGRLMSVNSGWRNRIALEIGTALGNFLGTLMVIALWIILKEVHILLALMVFLASLVLFELAQGGMEHIASWKKSGTLKRYLYQVLQYFLDIVLTLVDPVLRKIMPDLSEKLKSQQTLTWIGLFSFSVTVPFILGLDDFAGYVPLFNIVNVYGFAIGVFLGHTLLNIALFISPAHTITAVKNEYVSFLGTLAFIGLAFYGLFEVAKILLHPIFAL